MLDLLFGHDNNKLLVLQELKEEFQPELWSSFTLKWSYQNLTMKEQINEWRSILL